MQKKHPSKVSYPLYLAVISIINAPMLIDLFQNEPTNLGWELTFVVVLTTFITYLFFFTSYTIVNDSLIIKSGFFSEKIAISKIKEIQKTNYILSAPAPSFNRILVKYGKFDEVIISPKNKRQFVNDLLAVNSGIINKLDN